MYNGIGLRTARGSGTNGYVQRNLSHVRPDRLRRMKEGNRQREDFKLPQPKLVNHDILEHNRKRQVAAKLFELRVHLEDQGCSAEAVDRECSALRSKLNAEHQQKIEAARQRAAAQLALATTGGGSEEAGSPAANGAEKGKNTGTADDDADADADADADVEAKVAGSGPPAGGNGSGAASSSGAPPPQITKSKKELQILRARNAFGLGDGFIPGKFT